MNPIHQNLISYFINSAKQKEYEFAESVSLNEISAYYKGKATFNDHWAERDVSYVANKIVKSYLKENDIKITLNRVDDNIFEDIWLQCKNKEEKEECINVFEKFLISNDYKFPNALSTYSNEAYVNILLNKFYLKDKTSSRNDDSLTPIIEFFNYSKMSITPENLSLACKINKRFLSKLPVKNLLKDFVEQHLPDNVEDFRTYWKKIDSELVANQEVVNVCPCIAIEFNKTFIYNLNPGNNVDFYEKKLKAINTFINKTKFKKDYPIERSVFDGVQDSQEDYRFIIFGDKPELNFKEVLTDFVIKIISIDDHATPQILNSALSYIRLAKKTEKAYPTKNKIKI